MATSTDHATDLDGFEPESHARNSRLTGRGAVILIALGAVVFLGIGLTLGVAIAPSSSTTASSNSSPSAVDIGFAQDMIVHHTQGIEMANLEQKDSQNTDVTLVAYDIGSTQQADVGEMEGWLDLWGAPRIDSGTVMSWMGSDMDMPGMTSSTTAVSDGAVMPGMATNAEITKLAGLKGTASDIYFLQLMIRHHEGGAPMMEYAAAHASTPVTKAFAAKMLAAQNKEIGIMTQQLATYKASPLPFTAATVPTS